MPSKKHQRLMDGGSDKHHFLWPKKLYKGLNEPVEMSYRTHHEYHGHFMAKCKMWEHRICHRAFCQFAPMCCYHKTEIDYGRRVV